MGEKSGWQLCGDGPQAYEKYIVPAFSGAWARDIVERAAVKKGDSVLDLGCGTGLVARQAAKVLGASGQIAGVDVNPIMLAKAREVYPPNASPAEWQQGDASALPFADARFNVVLCQQGLQYFPDRLGSLKEVKRVLADGGRAVFSVWRSIEYLPFYTAVHDALAQYINAEAAAMIASAFTLGKSNHLRKLFTAAGFSQVGIRIVIKQMRYAPLEEFLIGGFAASPFANDILALEASMREEMFGAISQSVSNYVDDHGLAAPMECFVVSVMK